MADDAGDLRVDELLRDGRAHLRIGLVVLAHQFELDRLAADLELLRGGFVDGQARAVLVVLAEVRDAAGQRAGMADLDGDDSSSSAGARGSGLRGFRGLLRLFLAAAVDGDERGRDERQAELAGHVHGSPPREWGCEDERETDNYWLCRVRVSMRRRARPDGVRAVRGAPVARPVGAGRGLSRRGLLRRRPAALRSRFANADCGRRASQPAPANPSGRLAASKQGRRRRDARGGRPAARGGDRETIHGSTHHRRRVAVGARSSCWRWSLVGGHRRASRQEAAQEGRRARRKSAPVTLEFAPADLAVRRDASRCRAGCRCPARCSRSARRPSRRRSPATCARSPCAKARPCRPASCSRASTRPTSRPSSSSAQGALEIARRRSSRWPRRRARSNQQLLNENFISQNAFDNSESSFNVAQGSVKSAEAQVQLAQNALQGRGRHRAADGHRRQAPRAAGREGRVRCAARHRRRPEGASSCRRWCRRSTCRSSRSACRSSSRSTASASAASPAASSASIRRPSPARARSSSTSALPNRRRRAARRHVRDRPHRARRRARRSPTLPATAVRTEAGQTFVWAIDDGKLVAAHRRRSAAATTRTGCVEIKTALPPKLPVLAARFDNLKEGAPALVKAPTSPQTPRDGRDGATCG